MNADVILHTSSPSEIKKLFEETLQEFFNKEVQPNEQTDTWLNLRQLCEYLPNKPARATVYGWIRTKRIPHYKGEKDKTLRFSKSEINDWLRKGKRMTESELLAEALEYSNRKLKKGG